MTVRRPLLSLLVALGVWAGSAGLADAQDQPEPDRPQAPSQRLSALGPASAVALRTLSFAGGDSLRAAAERQDDRIGPYRFGRHLDAGYTPARHGTWEQLPTGDWVWRLRLRSPDAVSVSLGLTPFDLPTGARLYLRGPEGETVRGPYVAADATGGALWTPVVQGDELTLELEVPKGKRGAVELTVGTVVHGWRSIAPALGGETRRKSGACNLDVACEEAAPWRNQVRSVGRYTFRVGNRQLACTGALVNNTAEDGRPLFLTAEHCVRTASQAQSMVFYWNFQNPTCRNPGTTESGTFSLSVSDWDQTSTGARLLARYGNMHVEDLNQIAGKPDLTLVEVDDVIPASYDLFLSGWSRTGATTQESVTIHHPAGHGKRISFDRDPSALVDYPTTQTCQAPSGDTHLVVQDWELGTTEQGSSGSPLFDTNQRIVGVLSGGCAGCDGDGDADDNDAPDWYGRVAPGFSNGDYTPDGFLSPATLADWLDPTGSGVSVLDGRPQADVSPPDPPSTVAATAAPDSVTLDWTASDSADVAAYRVYRSTAPIDSSDAPPSRPVYAEVPADTTRYVDTGVTLSTKYYYRLTAVNKLGAESSPSGQATARPGEIPSVSVQPDSLGATTSGAPVDRTLTLENEGPTDSRLTFAVDSTAVAKRLRKGTNRGTLRPLDAGGPDAFGYRWVDSTEPSGPVFRWRDIRSAGTRARLSDDGGVTVPTPDGFAFYGRARSDVTISANGYLTFGEAAFSPSNAPIPRGTSPNALVAPFWDDLNPERGGTVHYLRDTATGRLIVQWTDVVYDSGTGPNTFQVVLAANGTIRFYYRAMTPRQSATIGIENGAGSDGLQVAFDTTYVTDSLAVRIDDTPPLVSDVQPSDGALRSGDRQDLTVTLAPEQLPEGTYERVLPLLTNNPSAPVVKIPVGLTIDRIATPSGLRARADSPDVRLRWRAVTDSALAGYEVYRSTAPFSTTAGAQTLHGGLVGDTTYTDTAVAARTRYVYRIRAVDTTGGASVLSRPALGERPIRTAAVEVAANETYRFPPTGTAIGVSGLAGRDTVTVHKFGTGPPRTDSIKEANVSDYRFRIFAGDSLSFDTATLRFAADSLWGVDDAGNVALYRRDRVDEPYVEVTSLHDGTNDELLASTPSFGDFVFASNTEPLPVEITRFEGRIDRGRVILRWQTAGEEDNVGFRIQRRRARGRGSGGAWTSVGFVEGAGTTSKPRSYRFTDPEVPYESGAVAYRLQQVDADGSTRLTDPIAVERSPVERVELRGTYPNPARHRATIRYAVPERQDVTLRLYDVLGRRVRTVVRGERQGRHEARLDVDGLSSGVYFLRLQTDGATRTRKLTVVR